MGFTAAGMVAVNCDHCRDLSLHFVNLVMKWLLILQLLLSLLMLLSIVVVVVAVAAAVVAIVVAVAVQLLF